LYFLVDDHIKKVKVQKHMQNNFEHEEFSLDKDHIILSNCHQGVLIVTFSEYDEVNIL